MKVDAIGREIGLREITLAISDSRIVIAENTPAMFQPIVDDPTIALRSFEQVKQWEKDDETLRRLYWLIDNNRREGVRCSLRFEHAHCVLVQTTRNTPC